MFKKLALVALSIAAIAVSGVQAGGHSKARNKTVIFDIDAGKVAQPYNFNNLVPGTTRSHGIHQARSWDSPSEVMGPPKQGNCIHRHATSCTS